MEIWKDIKNYEGLYQVSNFGNVRSLDRIVTCKDSKINNLKGKILNTSINNKGYKYTRFSKNGVVKTVHIHQLVAMNFLNHKPCGHKFVVNHINFDRTDNRVENLEIVTTRENTNRKHLKSSSKYTGVCWYKNYNKWYSNIRINGKKKHLGYFENEYDAHLAYQKALSYEINKI